MRAHALRGAGLTRMVLALALAACGSTPAGADGGDDASSPRADAALADAAPPAPRCPVDVADAIDPAAFAAELDAIAAIGAAHGDRAAGTPGADATVAHLESALRALGLDVERDPFEHAVTEETRPPLLELADASGTTTIEPPAIAAWMRSATAEVEGPLVELAGDPGAACSACDGADWAAVTPGAVALVRGTPDDLGALSTFAWIARAGALLVEAPDDEPEGHWAPNGTAAGLPVLFVGRAAAARVRDAERARVAVALDPMRRVTSVNLLATIAGEQPGVAVTVGAHLDGVLRGPGVNDNGTGLAAVLAIATALRRCRLRRGVRVAFWGAEEWGLLGSSRWVERADPAVLASLDAYLNLDMIGSPNGGTFLLGDPAGLGGWLRDWLDARGHPWAPEERLVDRSDHAAFRDAGVPVAGIFAGAEGILSDEEAARFGGVAGEPYDACYHRPCDDRSRVDEARARLAAQAIGALAQALATR